MAPSPADRLGRLVSWSTLRCSDSGALVKASGLLLGPSRLHDSVQREAATKLPEDRREVHQAGQIVLFTREILAERVRFELTGLSSSGFQVWVRAFAGVRG